MSAFHGLLPGELVVVMLMLLVVGVGWNSLRMLQSGNTRVTRSAQTIDASASQATQSSFAVSLVATDSSKLRSGRS